MALLVLGISLLAFSLLFHLTRGRHLPEPLNLFFKGKTQYLVVGFLIGFGFSSEIEGRQFFQHIQVTLTNLFIGWIGLQLGVNVEFRMLRKLSPRSILFDITQSAVTFILLLIVIFILLPEISQDLNLGENLTVLALTLSTAASIAVHGGLDKTSGLKEHVLGNSVSLILFGCISTLLVTRPPISVATGLFVGETDPLLISILIGLFTGVLLDMALRIEPALEKISYLAVALVAAAGGLCVALDLPALFSGFIAGVWLINTTLRRQDVQAVSNRLSPVIECLFLWVAGITIGVWVPLQLNIQGMLSLAMLIFLARAVLRTLGIGLLFRLIRPYQRDFNFIGMGLFPLGTLSIAICMQPFYLASNGSIPPVTIIGGMALAIIFTQATTATVRPISQSVPE